MPFGPRRYQRHLLSVELVFGLPEYVMEHLGPTDRSPEDLLLHIEQALESGDLSEADVLTLLADRARRE